MTVIWRDGVRVELDAAAAAGLEATRPVPLVFPRFVAKTTVYRRMADAELVVLDAALAAAPLRSRRMWNDAEAGPVPLADMQRLAVQLFGAARAAELLAEE